MATRIKLRRDTSANWVLNNPTLEQGEIGIVTDAASDSVKLKIGDGSTAWSSLLYFSPGSSAATWGNISGTLADQADLQTILSGLANDSLIVHLAGTETITGNKTFSGNLTLGGASGSKALVTDASGNIVESTVTSTQVGWLAALTGLSTTFSNITSAIVSSADSVLTAIGKLQGEINYLISGYVTPEMYGAAGDGVTDDSSAFNAIPSSRMIRMKAGATYLIKNEANFFDPSNVIDGNFATLKRSNAVVTTLTQAAALKDTQLHVTSVTGFSVGDKVCVTSNADTYSGTAYQENSNRSSNIPTITAIDSGSNILTISYPSIYTGIQLPEDGSLDVAGEYPIGSNVIRLFDMWNQGNASDNVTIRNLIIDGNLSNNNYTYDWRVNNTGSLKGKNIHLENCKFVNLPSTNITVSGQVWFTNCYVNNLVAGMVHVSQSNPTTNYNGVWVNGCKGRDVGLHTTECGHGEGGVVTNSASVQEVWITNCNFENSLSAGVKLNDGIIFGNINYEAGLSDAYSDGKIYVHNNRFVNFNNISNIADASSADNQNIERISIKDCEFVNCGDLLINGNTITNGGGIRKIEIVGNEINNGRIYANEVYDLRIESNTLTQDETYSFPSSIIGVSNVNTVGHIYFKASSVKIIHNDVIGKTTDDSYCKRGIFGTSNTAAKGSGGVATNYGYYQDVDISFNTVRNHHEFEIITSDQTTVTNRTLELVGWKVSNNKIYLQKSNTTSQGIIVDPGVDCNNNLVYTYVSTQYGILALGVYSGGSTSALNGPFITQNKVFGPATNPIRIGIGSNYFNSVVTNNITQIEIINPSLNNSIVADNILLLTTGTPYYINEDEDSGVY